MKTSDEKKETLPARVKHLLWWCAGADLETLKACPSDHARFTALGMMMAVVPCLATVSFTFFLQQSFNLGAAALLGGAAWGAVLFVLDRLLLTFHRKGQREKLRALPRLTLAVCLAVVIGEPLLLRFFDTEVELQMRRDGQTVVAQARANAEARFKAEWDALLGANAEMQKRLDELKRARDEKEAAVVGEIEGRVGSGVKGDGPAARQKQAAFEEARTEYERARTELLPKVEENAKRLEQMRAEMEAEVKAIADAHGAARGPLARHAALFALMRSEPSTALTYVPLFVILLLMEVSPLTIKLTAEPGEYDRRLRLREENGVARAESELRRERESRDSFEQARRGVEQRIAQAVEAGRLDALEEQERETAKLFRAITLEGFRREILAQAPPRAQKFDREILIEVVDRPDLRVTLQPPAEAGATLTLAEIAGDLRRIGEEVAGGATHRAELLSATTSSGREVESSLPLLSQLEADRTLRLRFAAPDVQTCELPLA
jgi:hypothetical protein